jgi:hypothetical protein
MRVWASKGARHNDMELARSGLELDKSGEVWYRSMVLVDRQSSARASCHSEGAILLRSSTGTSPPQ